MIKLEINGISFDNFLNISVRREFDAVPSKFSFEATTDPTNVTAFPIQLGDECKIFIDEYCLLDGHIDDISVSHSLNTHSIAIKGSSKIADLIDSTMDATFIFEFKKGTLLKDAIEAIVAKVGVTSRIIDRVSSQFTEDKMVQGKIGDSVWSLLCQLAIEQQNLIGETGGSDIFLSRGGGQKIDWSLNKRVNDINNNVLSSSVSYTNSKRFNRYAIVSQGDLSKYKEEFIKEMAQTSTLGECIDEAIRYTRFNCTIAEQASDNETCQTRAEWQANMARTNGSKYECDIQGYKTLENLVVEPGYIVHVIDDYSHINADMLIRSVAYSFSASDGSKAKLCLVAPDAFTLIPVQPKKEESGNDFSDIFQFEDDENDNKT